MCRLPICSRRTRFSSSKYSTTSCCRRFIQPAIETTRNENGSKPARIAEGYHANDPVLSPSGRRFAFLDHTGNLKAAHDLVLEKLCDALNETQTAFPCTDLTLIFKIGSSEFPEVRRSERRVKR